MKISTLFILFLIAFASYAQDYYPKTTGDLTALSTWSTKATDGRGDTPTDFNTGNFIVNRSAIVTSNWVVNDLSINMPSDTNTLTLFANVEASGALALYKGLIKTNGRLSLNFDNGYIRQWVSGNIVGKVKIHKTISNSGWHLVGTCLHSVPLSMVKNGNNIDSLLVYNESVLNKSNNKGWEAITNFSQLMVKGKGYAFKFSKPGKLVYEGLYNNFNTGVNLSLTASPSDGTIKSDGWNLVANPMASSLDWNSAGRSNVDAAIYYYDSKRNKNICYIDGIFINGASNIISSLQGFWTHVSSYNTATLGMDAGDINYESKPLLRSAADTSGIIRMTISSDTVSDETVVRFKNNASIQFDPQYDAYSISGFSVEQKPTTLSLCTVSENTNFAVNTLPTSISSGTIRIPLGITGNATKYNLNFKSTLTDSLRMYLYDSQKDSLYTIKNSNIVVSHAMQDKFDRYVLILDKDGILTEVLNDEKTSYTVTHFNNVVTISNAKNSSVYVANLVGQVVFQQEITNNEIQFSLPDGFYILNFIKDGKAAMNRKLVSRGGM